MPADHDDDGIRVLLAQTPQRLQAVDPRHLHIQEDEVRMKLRVRRESIHRIGGGLHLVALEFEELPERGADPLFVVDDEDLSRHGPVPVVL